MRPNCRLLLGSHGLGNHAVSLKPDLLRIDVVRGIHIDRIDAGPINKGFEVKDARGLDLEILQLLVLQDDVLISFELVAFDNFAAL
jgi:hypothetical protein